MFLPPFFSFFVNALLYPQGLVLLSFFSLIFSDELVEAIPLTKQEEEIGIVWSWVKVGGFPAQPKEEAKTVMMEVSPPSCVYHPSA